MLSSGLQMTTLIISNEKMEDIMKIVKPLEDSGLFIKVSPKQSTIEQKNKK